MLRGLSPLQNVEDAECRQLPRVGVDLGELPSRCCRCGCHLLHQTKMRAEVVSSSVRGKTPGGNGRFSEPLPTRPIY
jgi:hypothetical protein